MVDDKQKYKGMKSQKVMKEFISAIMLRSIQDKKRGGRDLKRDATLFLTSEECELMCMLLNIPYNDMLKSLDIKADIQERRNHELAVRLEIKRLTNKFEKTLTVVAKEILK